MRVACHTEIFFVWRRRTVYKSIIILKYKFNLMFFLTHDNQIKEFIQWNIIKNLRILPQFKIVYSWNIENRQIDPLSLVKVVCCFVVWNDNCNSEDWIQKSSINTIHAKLKTSQDNPFGKGYVLLNVILSRTYYFRPNTTFSKMFIPMFCAVLSNIIFFQHGIEYSFACRNFLYMVLRLRSFFNRNVDYQY